MFFNFEQWLTDFYVGLVTDMANFVATVITAVFLSDSVTITGQTATADLDVVESVGTIVLIMALPLTIAAVIWQVMRSAAEGRILGIFRAVLGGILMVVVSRFTFWYGPEMIQGFDALTAQLIQVFNSEPGGITHALLDSFGFVFNPETDAWTVRESTTGPPLNPTWALGFATMGTIPIIPIIFLVILAIGALLVMMMLAFRRWALIVLLALAPLALMFLPAEKASKGVALKWLQIVVALLAAKPLAALILAISSRLLAATGEVSLIMLIVALLSFMIAAAAPLIAMKFFGFLSMEIGHAYAQAAGEGAMRGGATGLMRAGQQAASVRSSLGSRGGSSQPAKARGGRAGVAPAQVVKSGASKGAVAGAGGSAAAAGAAGPAAPAVAVAMAAKRRKL